MIAFKIFDLQSA